MKRVLAVILISLTLTGCAGTRIGDFVQTVKSAVIATSNITPQHIYIAANAFDIVEVSATNYLQLVRCPKNAPFCRSPSVTKQLIPLIRSGRIARNDAVSWAQANPNGFAEQSLYDKLTGITSTIKNMMQQYHTGGL